MGGRFEEPRWRSRHLWPPPTLTGAKKVEKRGGKTNLPTGQGRGNENTVGRGSKKVSFVSTERGGLTLLSGQKNNTRLKERELVRNTQGKEGGKGKKTGRSWKRERGGWVFIIHNRIFSICFSQPSSNKGKHMELGREGHTQVGGRRRDFGLRTLSVRNCTQFREEGAPFFRNWDGQTSTGISSRTEKHRRVRQDS